MKKIESGTRWSEMSAGFFNRLNEAANRVLDPTPNAFNMGRAGHTASFPKTHVRRAVIVAEDYSLGRAEGLHNVYEIRFRYYDQDAVADSSASSIPSSDSSADHDWHTDTSGHSNFLDARDGSTAFSLGDLVSVVWDDQSGYWLLCSAPGASPVVTYSNDTGDIIGAVFSSGFDPAPTLPLGSGGTAVIHFGLIGGIVFPGGGGLAVNAVDSGGNSFYYALTGTQTILTGLAPTTFTGSGTIDVTWTDGFTYSLPVINNSCSDAIVAGSSVTVQASGPNGYLYVIQSCCP